MIIFKLLGNVQVSDQITSSQISSSVARINNLTASFISGSVMALNYITGTIFSIRNENSPTTLSSSLVGKIYASGSDGLLYFISNNGRIYDLTQSGSAGRLCWSVLIRKYNIMLLGVFGASVDLAWDNTTKTLKITGSISSSNGINITGSSGFNNIVSFNDNINISGSTVYVKNILSASQLTASYIDAVQISASSMELTNNGDNPRIVIKSSANTTPVMAEFRDINNRCRFKYAVWMQLTRLPILHRFAI